MRWILAVAGAIVALAGAAAILGQVASGAQPWGPELRDNVVLAQSIPFAVALGVAFGLAAGAAKRRSTERRADGAIRRFSPFTVAGHWVITVGFVLALPTGLWQYLGGILDVQAPIDLYVIYRVHYVGAAVILFATAAFLAYWWMTGDRSLLVPRGRWGDHLLGLAHELPRPIGARLASLLRIDLRRTPPETGKFTFYETVVSFPSWAVVIALITVTGLVKAMRYLYPVPGPVLFVASTLHVVAMVVILVKLLDHLRYTLERWPLMGAMVTTWVSNAYVRLRHPGWRKAAEGGG